MNKITAAALCLIVTLSFNLNAQTYGLKLIGSAKLPNAINEDRVNIRGIDIQAIDSTGKFLTDSIGGDNIISYGLVMNGQGKYSFYPTRQNVLVVSTNFIQNINEGGIQKQIIDEIVSTTIVDTDDEVVFKTFSATGYTLLQTESGNRIKTRVKQTFTTRDVVLSESEDINNLCISDCDSSGKI